MSDFIIKRSFTYYTEADDIEDEAGIMDITPQSAEKTAEAADKVARNPKSVQVGKYKASKESQQAAANEIKEKSIGTAAAAQEINKKIAIDTGNKTV